MEFTGKERDSETGLDYFGARYYSGAQGRFTTPDWSDKPQAIPYADLRNPQTLNLYAYVVNNPLNRVDPLGHDWYNYDNKWHWFKGSDPHKWTDSKGNEHTAKSQGAMLMVAERTGIDARTGATKYNLTLYNQNQAQSLGTVFSGGGPGFSAIRDGNYTLRLDLRDEHGPDTLTPQKDNPTISTYGISRMHDITQDGATYGVVAAYGYVRAYLNPWPGSGGTDGAFVHGQFNGNGWTHGCLCYGPNRDFGEFLWGLPPHPLPVAIDVPVIKP
jgi:RHS repeat-associated protein